METFQRELSKLKINLNFRIGSRDREQMTNIHVVGEMQLGKQNAHVLKMFICLRLCS